VFDGCCEGAKRWNEDLERELLHYGWTGLPEELEGTDASEIAAFLANAERNLSKNEARAIGRALNQQLGAL
jgi:hypothetical protein